MQFIKPQPVESLDNLRERVNRLLRTSAKRLPTQNQLSLDLPVTFTAEQSICYPSKSIAEFLDFMTAAVPRGDIYLFGGVLRDLALLGRRGFNSDIDLVVEGDWDNCVSYLESLGAHKNKFGGYRLKVADWPVDIWNAKETWAIRQGFVQYKGIASITETTVLNWDAILMNWRTQSFIHRKNYLEELKARVLDIVLVENPNPLGMAVRVFRHLCAKDARKITRKTAKYLEDCAKAFSFSEIRDSEMRSYGNSVIEYAVYQLFEHMNGYEQFDIESRFSIASDILERELELDQVGTVGK